MPGGRPSYYDPAYCEKVVDLGRVGMSPAEMSAELGVPRQTLVQWAKDHEEFSAAYTHARDLAQAWFETQARMSLENPKFNSALWTAQVKSRFKADYTETTKHVGADDGPIKHEMEHSVAEEKARKIAEIFKAGLAK